MVFTFHIPDYSKELLSSSSHEFESRILELKRDANGEWIRLQIEELHSLYRSTYIVTLIKTRKLRWAG